MSRAGVVSRPRVYVRIRPFNEREKTEGKGERICHGEPSKQDVLYLTKEENAPELQVRFDHVFEEQTTQLEVYDLIGPEVQRSLFGGYNASIFAYGQTGSGKTHTIEGDRTVGAGGGLLPHLVQGIFDTFTRREEITNALVEISLVQIYQEHVQDLLVGRKQLEIRMDLTGQYVARDATWRQVRSLEDCMKVYVEASRNRSTSATEMNLVSSRSHMIMMMRLQWDEPTLPGSHAQLNIIDLAGSERLNESGSTGGALIEAIHINKSLSALGNVVIKLVEQAKRPKRRIHIPYKDSKLTYLLQSSLGGSNLVHFVLAVSPSALWRGETISSIEFGKRALQLVLHPVRNAIDYTRLAEMEEMIERMRSHIASLEAQLENKRSSEAADFLQMKQIFQSDEDAVVPERRRRNNLMIEKRGYARKHLKRQTELSRIMENLPETFDELTSHCVLFPESKVTFRELGGLEKLVHFVESSVSTFYRSNAAQTIASVIDETGLDIFSQLDGLRALTRLLQVEEERCKESACVAFEAVCRGCLKNKALLPPAVYTELVNLIYDYPNQQVQEAACAAVATIVDAYPEAVLRFEKLAIVPKLLNTIRTAPAEVVNLTKAAANCLGRLAHGNSQTQALIASLGGVDLLVDVLFSPGGSRDHQVPILASYALVSLCCSSKANIKMVEAHPRYGEVKFRLLEGLARAFGTNTAHEGFGRATAQEATAAFPYFGITVQDRWGPSSSGGRPIFSTFMDNPQFYLYVHDETDIAFIIQDTLYEARMRKKLRNSAVYMGIAIFEGDPELAKMGLKQLDFHSKMVVIGQYTSNCENVLHCRLPPSETPYVVVAFTSQRGRQTEFALSAFADKRIELTAVPEQVGWVHTVLDGRWTEFTGRSGDGFDWRCNPQILLHPKENCRAVFVLSYASLEEKRVQTCQEGEEEHNHRPKLHGRLFTNDFAPTKRYLKALVPLPKGSTFVASNTFASNCYITTSANLIGGTSYVYVPFTETPFQDTYRVSVYCDSSEGGLAPLEAGPAGEWHCISFASAWVDRPAAALLETTGRMVVVAYSPGTFLRVRLYDPTSGTRVGGIDSYWNREAAVEYVSTGKVIVKVEGVVRAAGAGENPTAASPGSLQSRSSHTTGGEGLSAPPTQPKAQEFAKDRKFDLFIFSEETCTVHRVDFIATASTWPIPTQATSSNLLQNPHFVEETDVGPQDEEDPFDDNYNDILHDDEADFETELLEDLERKEQENRLLNERLAEQAAQLASLQREQTSSDGVSPSSNGNGSTSTPLPPLRGNAKSGNPPPALAQRTSSKRESDLRESIEFTLLKLNAMNKRAGGSGTAESGAGDREVLRQLQKDIADVQERLFRTLEKCDAVGAVETLNTKKGKGGKEVVEKRKATAK